MARGDPDALRDDQWERLRDLIPGGRAEQRRPICDNPRFIDALLCMARSGGRWRGLPQRLGAIAGRSSGATTAGSNARVWTAFLAALSAEAGLEWLLLDRAIVRATSTPQPLAWPKGDGCPGPGPLSRGFEHQDPRRRRSPRQLGAAIADKGYEADPLHDATPDTPAEPVTQPRRHRRRRHAYDKALYKERNLIERFFNTLEQFRRIATRCDKLPVNVRGFVLLAAVVTLLR